MSFDDQATRFHHEVVDLVKKYQFRDRNRISSCGISVSQCYALEALHRFGPLTMNRLAEKMYLTVSTMTRVVDQLHGKGYVVREECIDDRRFRMIRITGQGETAFQRSWKRVFESEKRILERFPQEHRKMLIELLRKLNQAVLEWRDCCSGE